MEKEQLILRSAQEFNILPLTSHCDARCVFCSHRYNPPQVRVVTIAHRTMAEVERTLAFLDYHKKITIGESATSIIEGEPFSHPQFSQVIKLVRERFPRTVISLTTNGHRINEESLDLIKDAEPVEINLSLNSASVQGRKILMGDKEDQAQKAIEGVKLLNTAKIPFHGSIVAMPHLVGWNDLEETIVFLAEHGAITIRIFMAGYAENANTSLKFNPKMMHQRLTGFIDKMAEKVHCPLLLEPPEHHDLKPITAGVIWGSKAQRCGIKRGDLILSINGQVPRSRVEAWQYSQKPGNIEIVISRQGQLKQLSWRNIKGEKSGLVMEYDFDMERLDDIEQTVNKHPGRILFLCSALALGVMQAAWGTKESSHGRVDIQPVNNNFFGGSIGSAGLLTIDDYYSTYLQYKERKGIPELILVPRESFDYLGRDLTGRPLEELEEKTGVKVIAE